MKFRVGALKNIADVNVGDEVCLLGGVVSVVTKKESRPNGLVWVELQESCTCRRGVTSETVRDDASVVAFTISVDSPSFEVWSTGNEEWERIDISVVEASKSLKFEHTKRVGGILHAHLRDSLGRWYRFPIDTKL